MSAKSIVLVDDERSYVDLLTQMLAENLDCQVHAFSRPTDALAALGQLQPGVVVTDYFMPGMNGLELIREAAPRVPRAAFILITGQDVSSEKDAMARLAVLKGFLPKPFGWRKLAEEIRRVWPDPATIPNYRADPESL